MEDMLKLGPKVMKGETWDEKGIVSIVEIQISHQQDLINSIRFTHFSEKGISHSQIYGEFTGLMFNSVEFAENEHLVGLYGEYKDGRLASIVFDTNKGTYGPFGRTGSRCNASSSSYEEFKYVFNTRRFGGFHGSVYDGTVSAIGVYIKNFSLDNRYDPEFEAELLLPY